MVRRLSPGRSDTLELRQVPVARYSYCGNDLRIVNPKLNIGADPSAKYPLV